jgi:uncharacterized protein YbjT (DUF2867 family)
MKLAVTGGTGFTGKRVLELLFGRKDVRCIVRDPARIPDIEAMGFEVRLADVSDPKRLLPALEGCRGLINIVSLGFGHAPGIVECAERAGIERALFVGTTAVETRLNAPSKAVRLEAERSVKESNLEWTLVRPTMIYGAPDDRNIIKLIRFLWKSPVVIVPGSGEFLQQPVFVEDLARGILDAFSCPKAVGKTYDLSGAEPLTFNRLIIETLEALEITRPTFHVPVKPAALLFRVLEKIVPKPFLREEQVWRLVEDKSFSHEEATRDFGFDPRPFREGIREEVALFFKERGIIRPGEAKP